MIIGISGNARHGKDTIANFIAEYLTCEIYHLADPMKEAAKILMDWNDSHVYGDLKETIDPRWGISPREFLQWIGTDVFQCNLNDYFQSYTGGRNHWVKLLLEKCSDPEKIYVVPDVRFIHEAKAIKKHGGIIIKVTRDIKTDVPNHASEREISQIEADYYIENDGSLSELRGKVFELLDGIG